MVWHLQEEYVMRILIIEDDESLHRILSRRLTEEGYAIDGCYNGQEGLEYMETGVYDCIILDWMLPEKDGVTILKEFRRKGRHTPVLMLTAKDSVMDRVAGLDAGADDYLTKPFAYDELSARVRALLRRNSGQSQNVLQLADLVMDLPAHRVLRAGNEILLTSKEYALLEYMLRNQGQALTRSQIADHVWNYNFDYDSNIVDVYIRYLRNKIDKEYSNPLIHTVRGYGYVIKDESEKQ